MHTTNSPSACIQIVYLITVIPMNSWGNKRGDFEILIRKRCLDKRYPDNSIVVIVRALPIPSPFAGHFTVDYCCYGK